MVLYFSVTADFHASLQTLTARWKQKTNTIAVNYNLTKRVDQTHAVRIMIFETFNWKHAFMYSDLVVLFESVTTAVSVRVAEGQSHWHFLATS